MKRLFILICMVLLFTDWSVVYSQNQNLSTPIAVKAQLTQPYQGYEIGTPVVIRQLVRRKNANMNGLFYALEINGVQMALPKEEKKVLEYVDQDNEQSFWQQVYLENELYEHFQDEGYRMNFRREINDECQDYLNKLEELRYNDDYITSLVQGVFARLISTNIDPNRIEKLYAEVIQTSDPEAYMLPNGTMLVSIGLLSVLDSEDELAAMMACEMAHFVLDHQIYNIRKAEARAARAAFWGGVFADLADIAYADAYWYDDDRMIGIGLASSLASLPFLLNAQTVNRLGMEYKEKQEIEADRIAKKLLRLKGYNEKGLATALQKIRNYYKRQQQQENIIRYGSLDRIDKRIAHAGTAAEIDNRTYHRMMSDVVTYNAAINLANKRYAETAELVEKNIKNDIATTNDYVLLVKANMAQYNTEEINNQCVIWLEQADMLAGSNPNLDVCKQRILLLLRMNNQLKAADELKKYCALLSEFQGQEISTEDRDWSDEELKWATKLLDKINRI